MPFSTEISATHMPRRDWQQAVLRGLRCRCPACGKGKLFGAFIKPVLVCESCAEDISPQRADDLPPYIVITIVGHIVVGGLLLAEQYADWSFTTHMLIWPALVLILSLALMQPVKGAVIGLQWGLRMHGFDKGQADTAPAAPIMRQDGI
jgi:uncharacterized protein (DUF983 family)